MYYSKACSKYGASMGRSEFREHSEDESLKFRLARVPLNAGGYDPGGAYWGTPSNLYVAEVETETESEGLRETRLFRRAASREACKALIIATYPNARFYR